MSIDGVDYPSNCDSANLLKKELHCENITKKQRSAVYPHLVRQGYKLRIDDTWEDGFDDTEDILTPNEEQRKADLERELGTFEECLIKALYP